MFNIKISLEPTVDVPLEAGEVVFLVTTASEEQRNEIDEYGSTLSLHRIFQHSRISPTTFADLFPFHMVFNRKMQVSQVGKALARVLPYLIENSLVSLTTMFELERPRVPLTFSNILAHINTVYVLIEIDTPLRFGRRPLRLKGQMSLLQDGLMLFLASPSVAKWVRHAFVTGTRAAPLSANIEIQKYNKKFIYFKQEQCPYKSCSCV